MTEKYIHVFLLAGFKQQLASLPVEIVYSLSHYN